MTIEVGVSRGAFVPTFGSGTLIIASSSSGTLFTITPPSKQRVRLNCMASQSGGMPVTLKVGDSFVLTEENISRLPASGEFTIGAETSSLAEPSTSYGAIPYIIGGIDEVIILSATVATGNTINYGYETGVFR